MNYSVNNQNQKHVHELMGSVKISDSQDPHGHRFCAVTGESIGNQDHIHEVAFRTDFHENHYHEFIGRTGYQIPVGDRHVHFIESVTSVDDGHWHTFEAATLINDPNGAGHMNVGQEQEEDFYDYDDEYPDNDYNRT